MNFSTAIKDRRSEICEMLLRINKYKESYKDLNIDFIYNE